jgi:hypothetical protein
MVLMAVVAGIAGGAVAETVLIEEQFVDPIPETYDIWGTADPFNRVEAYEGNLELEGSFGFEAFGVYFMQEMDLSAGPITISFDLVRNSSNDGSEICVWFVNQYLVEGDPWTEGDFVRIGFFSNREEVGRNVLMVQETSPGVRGMGAQLAAIPNAFSMGVPMTVEWALSSAGYTVSVDGTEVVSGDHSLTIPTGYLFIHDWNSLEGEVDLLSDLTVTQ